MQAYAILLSLVCVLSALLMEAEAFTLARGVVIRSRSSTQLKMAYVPDGMSKEQWEALKKKEADELKKKGNLGALGTTKFKSRSFEAWQKAGAVHLFPVDPTTTPYEERPYMQRKDGAWDGSDLKKRKIEGKGQGLASVRLKIDTLYEKAKSEGKLDSASILGGVPLPWTTKQTNEMNASPSAKQGPRGVAGKKLSKAELDELKSKLVKPIVSKKVPSSASATTAAAPKKFFGLF